MLIKEHFERITSLDQRIDRCIQRQRKYKMINATRKRKREVLEHGEELEMSPDEKAQQGEGMAKRTKGRPKKIEVKEKKEIW